MIIFHAEKVNANYNTYKNGLIYLSVIISIICFLNFTEPEAFFYSAMYGTLLTIKEANTELKWDTADSTVTVVTLWSSISCLIHRLRKLVHPRAYSVQWRPHTYRLRLCPRTPLLPLPPLALLVRCGACTTIATSSPVSTNSTTYNWAIARVTSFNKSRHSFRSIS